MAKPKIAPYGSWKSPISAELVAAEGILLYDLTLDGETIYWSELRPAEGGRYVIMRRTPKGQVEELLPQPFNARTCVHEYGGGALALADGAVIFSNFSDQRLYRLEPGAVPEPLSPEAALRYADGEFDAARGRMIYVLEDHTLGGQEPVNSLAAVDLESGAVAAILASGADFYSNPRLSPDGARLAWLSWNHPNMPWDGDELWVAEVKQDGSLGEAQFVAGGQEESLFQPTWSPDGTLYFASDRNDWWNLYRWAGSEVEPLLEMQAEFAIPHWLFKRTTYAFEPAQGEAADTAGRIVCTYSRDGLWYLATVDAGSGELRDIQTPYTDITYVNAAPGRAVFVGGSASEPMSVVACDLETGELEVVRRDERVEIDPAYLSRPEPVSFPTEGGETAYGLYYPPTNPGYRAPEGERPPLLVYVHGGPTSAARTYRILSFQYFTSRGFGLLDVNYRGSTGYGRRYRQRLNGNWGLVDVQDSQNGARYLAEQGRVDGARLAARGGSAGGYTTLAALTFGDVFCAGASAFGLSELSTFAEETHKFEKHYLESLVAPYPQRKDIYDARSPLHHLDKLAKPIIFFQGLDDKIVLPNQAEMMVAALREKGVPVAYLAFEGESHGFRKAETIRRYLQAELYFYGRVLGFEPGEALEPIPIDNL